MSINKSTIKIILREFKEKRKEVLEKIEKYNNKLKEKYEYIKKFENPDTKAMSYIIMKELLIDIRNPIIDFENTLEILKKDKT